MDDSSSREARSTMRQLRHEMRTGLGQILGYSEMLQEDLEDRGLDDLLSDAGKIRDAAQKLLAMAEEIFRTDAVGAAAGGGGSTPETGPETAPPTPGGRVLVVDDDESNREMISRRLERAGHEVETAADGVEALDRIGRERFDVVVLDVMMPGIDGLEVLSRVRRSHSMTELPVLMATALGASEDTVRALRLGANDYVAKPLDMPTVLARIATQLELVRAVRRVRELASSLEIRNAFIRRVLGRYVSDEIAADVLENPGAMEMRGQKRRVTILLSDLRGFTTLTERSSAVDVVRLLNNYLGTMAEIVKRNGGTIDEFIGDAILALFGAPVAHDDDPLRAVTCALEMQAAMDEVNARNREMRLPEVEMGVGIATGDVIVGNIGSEQRTKYGAVGSAVNLAARVESQTSGADILICPWTHVETAEHVVIGETRELHAKGFEASIEIRSVVGLRGRDDLGLAGKAPELHELRERVAVLLTPIRGKALDDAGVPAWIQAAGGRWVRVDAPGLVEPPEAVRLQLVDLNESPVGESCYARLVPQPAGAGHLFRISSRSPDLDAALRSSAASARGQ